MLIGDEIEQPQIPGSPLKISMSTAEQLDGAFGSSSPTRNERLESESWLLEQVTSALETYKAMTHDQWGREANMLNEMAEED